MQVPPFKYKRRFQDPDLLLQILKNRKDQRDQRLIAKIAMEFSLRRSGGQEGEQVKEEKTNTESIRPAHNTHEAPPHLKQDTTLVQVPRMNDKSVVDTGPPHASSSAKNEEVDELESARVEMGEVREENQRLKMCLERIMKEYQALQMQFHVIAQQEAAATKPRADQKPNNNNIDNEESDLVSLSLGRVSATTSNNEKSKVVSSKPAVQLQRQGEEQQEEEEKQDLALGLDCKFETSKSGSTTEALPNNNNGSPTNSSELVHKEEEAGESWPPSKALNNKSTRDSSTDQDEVSQQNPAKRARVCVRARCETPTLNDGCQWRKYGQKISKGNPCPRAYYRCTVAPNCPVRKQVQRCAEDMTVLITTYEGNHNHPLPLAATAMASTTSAAASMLLSGSSSTSNNPTGLGPSSTASAGTIIGSDLPGGINFYLPDGSKPKHQFYLSSPALSPSPSHPTITLDLTSNPSSSNYFTSHFNRFINSNYNNPPRFPPSTTSLSFSSSDSNAMSWSNNNVGFLGYNYNTQPYNNNRNILSSINLGRQLPIQTPPPHPPHQNPSLPDTIAAATKVITADPTFQSALAAALTSIIGTGNNNSASVSGNSTQGVGEVNLGQKINLWGDIFPASASGSASSNKVSGCGSSFLSKTTTTTAAGTQAAGSSGLMFLPPSLPFSSSKTASALSPADNRDKSNS